MFTKAWGAALLLSVSITCTVNADSPQTGIASWYGPGNGVATQWCSWLVRHKQGCGILAIQSKQTGRIVYAPVIDWCQCLRGTPQARIVDLQLGVVAALGLNPSQGLYPVITWRVEQQIGLPNTAADDGNTLTLIGILLIGFAALLLFDYWWRRR